MRNVTCKVFLIQHCQSLFLLKQESVLSCPGLLCEPNVFKSQETVHTLPNLSKNQSLEYPFCIHRITLTWNYQVYIRRYFSMDCPIYQFCSVFIKISLFGFHLLFALPSYQKVFLNYGMPERLHLFLDHQCSTLSCFCLLDYVILF